MLIWNFARFKENTDSNSISYLLRWDFHRTYGTILIALSFVIVGCTYGMPDWPSFGSKVTHVAYLGDGSDRTKIAMTKLQRAIDHRFKNDSRSVKVDHILMVNGKAETSYTGKMGEQPDVVLALSQDLAEIAQREFTKLPVIFATQVDPVGNRLVKAYLRPGGNLTGISFHANADYKPLEVFSHSFPTMRRIGIIVDKRWMDLIGNPLLTAKNYLLPHQTAELFFAETQAELSREVNSPRGRNMDGWFVPNTKAPFEDSDGVIASMSLTGKPVIYSRSPMVEKGGLLSYQYDLQEPYALIAELLMLILNGMPTGEIPIERPRHFEISLNLATARAQGISVPAELVARADRIFK